jgi:hypothetical protein
VQLHNPYIATPLSIASYRMATSPSDQNNKNVLAWLDRLQASVKDAGGKAGPLAFKKARSPSTAFVADDQQDDSDDEASGGRKLTHAQRFGLVPVEEIPEEDGEGVAADPDEVERARSALPDSHVPLGLIANLSLSNNPKVKSVKKDGKEELNDEDLNDDNVVRDLSHFPLKVKYLNCSSGGSKRNILLAWPFYGP